MPDDLISTFQGPGEQMDQSRSAQQEVPAEHAVRLRELLDVDNALLNALLAAYRTRGWHTPTLARALDMKPPAISKRIERARRAAALAGPDVADLSPGQVEQALAGYDAHRLEQARIQRRLAEFEIPDAPRIQATIDGKQLAPDKIAELQRMQRIASRVNGALPAEHPDRRVSEAYTAELYRLVTEEQFTPYYLSRVLGVSHRAITSRLERHHYREPCPSVAGTSSGVYFGRKIGDPGQGAPRLTRAERAELRALWGATQGATTAGDRERAQGDLGAKVMAHLDAGFTLANLAQAMSGKQGRVRPAALQAALTAAWARSRTRVGS